jgi:hypothetical protein
MNDIMEKSRAWEANSFSTDQETTRILHNPKVHQRVHKSKKLVPILGQINTT